MPVDVFREKTQLLKVVAHPTRLMILAELAKGVKCVREIEELLHIPQSNVSQHLTILRHNKLVDFYEEGALRCYYLKNPHMVQDLLTFLNQDYPLVERSKEEVKKEGQRRKQQEACLLNPSGSEGKLLSQMSQQDIKAAVSEKYSRVAVTPWAKFNFPVGRKFAESVGYSEELLEQLPEGIYESFTGAGNPQEHVDIKPGEALLDLGCGAGLDLYLYAQKISPTGQLYGLDISQAMLDKARANLAQMGVKNCRLFCCPADKIPLEDNAVDVVTSNGIYNLSPDKEAVLREIWRVLKPGGWTVFSEIVLAEPLPEEIRKNINDWFRCIGGALPEVDFLELMRKVGFTRVKVLAKARNARCGHPLATCANIRACKP